MCSMQADCSKVLFEAEVKSEHTCCKGGTYGDPLCLAHLVDALQPGFCPGVAIGTYHAVDPHIPVQRAAEVPLCKTHPSLPAAFAMLNKGRRNGQ